MHLLKNVSTHTLPRSQAGADDWQVDLTGSSSPRLQTVRAKDWLLFFLVLGEC